MTDDKSEPDDIYQRSSSYLPTFEITEEKKAEAKKIIDELIATSDKGDFIYRGESEEYGNNTASSKLYREYNPKTTEAYATGIENNIEIAEKIILKETRRHFSPNENADRVEILAKMQHFGEVTNLIDFTENIYIALFFACNSSFDKDGKLLFVNRDNLQKADEIYPGWDGGNIAASEKPGGKPRLLKSISKNNRVIFQSSVFVHAHKGFLEGSEYKVKKIPADLKPALLAYIEKHLGITSDTVYNDLQGIFSRLKDRQKLAYPYYRNGLSNVFRNQLEEAIENFTEAIVFYPGFGLAYNSRGMAKAILKKYKKAIADFNEAIKLNPKDSRAYRLRGFSKKGLGHYEEAIADFDEAIKLNHEDSSSYCFRGEAKVGLESQKKDKDYTKAIEDFNDAIKLNPKFDYAYCMRGMVKYLLKKHEEAIEDLDKAIELTTDLSAPYLSEAYYIRGSAKEELEDLKQHKDYTEALSDIKECLSITKPDGVSPDAGLHKAALEAKNRMEGKNSSHSTTPPPTTPQ